MSFSSCWKKNEGVKLVEVRKDEERITREILGEKKEACFVSRGATIRLKSAF